MCCAAPAGVPRTRLALESRWILTIALSLKSLFTSARMSIIEATCARTSPELYLQCVAQEQAGLSLGFDLANWTDVICVVYLSWARPSSTLPPLSTAAWTSRARRQQRAAGGPSAQTW